MVIPPFPAGELTDLFESLSQVREMAWHWRADYKNEQPHESLGNLPPSVYWQKLENSSLGLSY